MNFFEGYVEKKELKLNVQWIYLVLLGFTAVFLVGYISYNMLVIKKENEIVNTLRQQVEDPSVVGDVERIREKEVQLNALQVSVDKVKILEGNLQQTMEIDDSLLEKINYNIPDNIFLTSINVEEEMISIVGISEDKWAIPEFQKNLESLEGYDEIFIPYITLEDDQYNFALDIEKRGVEENEDVVEERTNQE